MKTVRYYVLSMTDSGTGQVEFQDEGDDALWHQRKPAQRPTDRTDGAAGRRAVRCGALAHHIEGQPGPSMAAVDCVVERLLKFLPVACSPRRRIPREEAVDAARFPGCRALIQCPVAAERRDKQPADGNGPQQYPEDHCEEDETPPAPSPIQFDCAHEVTVAGGVQLIASLRRPNFAVCACAVRWACRAAPPSSVRR